MRLSAKEVSAIKERVFNLDNSAEVYLFGSRADDSKRGGDIDLLIISQTLTLEDKLKFRVGLYDELGEQKIDVALAATKDENAFVKHAIETGIKL